MAALAPNVALGWALMCIPHASVHQYAVSPDVVLAVAKTESGFDPLAIHDNSTGLAPEAKNRADAVSIAARLISLGHSVDLGFMQINAPANLAKTGLTVQSAFDQCASIRAGARVLLDGYDGGGTPEDEQASVLRALSRYNTGNASGGFYNGYVNKVLASARQVIPALRIPGMAAFSPPSQEEPPHPTAQEYPNLVAAAERARERRKSGDIGE